MFEFDLLQFGEFHFLRPWWLLALIPLTLCMLYIKRLNDPVAQWSKTIAPHLLAALTVSGGSGRWFNPVNISLLAIVVAVVAVSGPSWQRKPSPFVEDEAVLVIALDLSNTMNQADIQPSRLERAKQKIQDLMKLRGGARTGLVVYSGSAHSVIPLTNDPDILYKFLSAVNTEMMPKPGKFPEKVLPLVDQLLRDSAVPGSVLLIGDGVGPNSIGVFKDYFDGVQHQLLVMGIGLEEPAESERDTDQFGGAHLAIQTDELQALAKAAGGQYQILSIDKADVRRINRLVNHHLSIVDDGNRPWVDAGYYLLYPFALIFLLWFRRGWTLHWCLVLVLVGAIQVPEVIAKQASEAGSEIVDLENEQPLTSVAWRWFVDLWLTPDQQGRYYFERGDYETAAQRFRDPAWKGMAFYYQENFTAAIEMFTQIETADGLFNLANAQAQGQHYVMAVKTYGRVLKQAALYPGADKNRTRVQEIIDDINRLSESQRAEEGEASSELGDAPQRADGADEQKQGKKREVKQLSAEQVLSDQKMHDMWMRQIQQDPSRFLSVKFQMQLSQEVKGE
jgi:Ca-activated chloride channel family protein